MKKTRKGFIEEYGFWEEKEISNVGTVYIYWFQSNEIYIDKRIVFFEKDGKIKYYGKTFTNIINAKKFALNMLKKQIFSTMKLYKKYMEE